jgi:CRISPR-associated protein Csx10
MAQSLDFKLHVEFLSDWHVGEGAGQPGHVDRIVRRDPNGNLPYVPAKTLTGVWRDACEQVALGLDGGTAGNWCRWVEALFGGTDHKPDSTQPQTLAQHEPKRACLSVRPARFPEHLRGALRCNPLIAHALTFIKPGVALDKLGVAKEDFLRFEEVALAGAVLEADVSLELPSGANQNYALALLWAGARAAERLGGKRRRGHGRCKLSLAGIKGLPVVEELLKTLNADAPTAPSWQSRDPFEFKATGAQSTSDWHVIVLDITLLTPVVAFAAAVGNVVESLDYLPGTQLLAALNPRLRELLGAGAFAAVGRGDVRVLNAYPAVHEQRGLPVPMALHRVKEEPQGSQCIPVANYLYGEPADGVQRKQYRAGYVRGDGNGGGALELCKVNLQAATHATIDDRVQRPTADVGGVYTYQAIRAGSKFRSEVWIRSGLANNIESKVASLNEKYRIGTAKKDDYGLIEIKASLDKTRRPEPSAGGMLTLWLASPLLLRDSALRPVTNPDAIRMELEGRLKVRLEEATPANGIAPLFLRSHRDEGFQRSWGLPRVSRVGLAAGSVLRWQVTGTLDSHKLAALQAEGLGERRAEGYGEVIINSPLLHQELLSVRETRADTVTPVSGGGTSHATVPPLSEFEKELVKRTWRISMRRKALAKAADEEFRTATLGWTRDKPENSQLGSLRGQLEALTGNGDFGVLNQWLDRLKSKEDRWKKWPEKAQEALKNLRERPDDIWDWLDIDDEDVYPVLSTMNRNSLRTDLKHEVVRALWMAAIHAELKRRTRGGVKRKKQEVPIHG